MRKIIALIVFVVAVCSTAAYSGDYTITPRPGGGANIFGPGGQSTTVTPRVGGGYDAFGPGGSATTITPRVGGGYNVREHSMPGR